MPGLDKFANEARPGAGSAPLIAYVLKQRSIAFRIFLLVLIVALATGVRAIFGIVVPNTGFFAFYFPAVMITTILAGWEMGVLSIAASVAVATWLFMAPAMQFAPPNFSQSFSIASFVGAALLQTALAQWLRNVLKQMERNENRYRQLVNATSGIVWTTDADGMVEEPQPGWIELTGVGWPDYRGRAWTESVHEEDRGKLVFDMWNIDTTGAYHAEIRIWNAPSRDWRWFAARAVPIRDTSGNLREWITTITDVHARKLARDRREMVIGELRHRLKNLFTVIGSLAQSSKPRGEPAVDLFITKLTGRLHTLSAAADLVMARGRTSLELRDVAQATLAPFMEERSSRISIEGSLLELSEETGGAIALAVHELATNAIKYGALSEPGGKVKLSWWHNPVPEGERVEIEWKETGGPICTQPTQVGFGTRVIKFAASREKSGEVSLDYPPDGFYCRIVFVKTGDNGALPTPSSTFADLGIL
ncbi:MAG TPA: HWE histidine kinase domain-containing protein [Rhizomicrobium sp.]|jgi:PAS domain S-box-containing protein